MNVISYDKAESYLYITSHFFLIPVILSIYSNRYDILFFSLTILITSLLRWGYRNIIIYQYIDHNWVKLVYVYFIISIFHLIFYENYCFLTICFLFFLKLTILFIFILNMIISNFKNHLTIPLHMIIHFYSIFALIMTLFIDYDFFKTYYYLKDFFNQIQFKKINLNFINI